MRLQLADAQRTVKVLSWQVKVAVQQGGGGAAQSQQAAGGGQSQPGALGRAAGMFDIMGCGANYTRK